MIYLFNDSMIFNQPNVFARSFKIQFIKPRIFHTFVSLFCLVLYWPLNSCFRALYSVGNNMEAGRDKQISWVRGERGRDRQRNIVENTGPDMKIRNEDHLLRYEPNPSTSHLVFGSSQNPGRTREPSGLHQLTLENLIKLIDDRVEPSEIFRSIIDPDNVLTNNLKENLNNFDYLETVLVVIGRFCAKNGASLFADGFVTVVKTLADQNVFAQSSSIIIHIPMSSSSVLPSKEQRLKRLTSAICSIVTEVLVVMPSFGCGCFGRNFLSDILYLEAIPSVKMLNLSGVFDEVEDCIHLLEVTSPIITFTFCNCLI